MRSNRYAKLGLESLEDRTAPSATPLTLPALPAETANVRVLTQETLRTPEPPRVAEEAFFPWDPSSIDTSGLFAEMAGIKAEWSASFGSIAYAGDGAGPEPDFLLVSQDGGVDDVRYRINVGGEGEVSIRKIDEQTFALGDGVRWVGAAWDNSSGHTGYLFVHAADGAVDGAVTTASLTLTGIEPEEGDGGEGGGEDGGSGDEGGGDDTSGGPTFEDFQGQFLEGGSGDLVEDAATDPTENPAEDAAASPASLEEDDGEPVLVLYEEIAAPEDPAELRPAVTDVRETLPEAFPADPVFAAPEAAPRPAARGEDGGIVLPTAAQEDGEDRSSMDAEDGTLYGVSTDIPVPASLDTFPPSLPEGILVTTAGFALASRAVRAGRKETADDAPGA